MEIFEELLKVNRSGRNCVLITVIDKKGHGPAKSGFKPNQAVFRLEGRMRCLGDVPQSWELSSAIYDYTNGQQGALIENTQLNETVRVRKSKIRT